MLLHLVPLYLAAAKTHAVAPLDEVAKIKEAELSELTQTLKGLKEDLAHKRDVHRLQDEIVSVRQQLASVNAGVDAGVKEQGATCGCLDEQGNETPLAGWDGTPEGCSSNACGGGFSHYQKKTSSSSSSSSSTVTTTTTGGCFDKATTTACRLAGSDVTAEAAYNACFLQTPASNHARAAERVLMAELKTGDSVLTATTGGALYATRVVTNQHAHKDEVTAKMLVLHTTGAKMGRRATTRLSLTPDHALYVDGVLMAAAEARVGSTLTTADGRSVTVTRMETTTDFTATVINPVTASGTLLADGYLAASHPIWIAPYVLACDPIRVLVNAALLAVGGDVCDGLSFGLLLLAKTAALVAVSRMILSTKRATRTKGATSK